MSDYISRQRLLEKFEEFNQCLPVKLRVEYFPIIERAMRLVADEPAADVAPVVRGEWLPKNEIGDCCYQCSDCGFVRDAYILDIGHFCPNCGARMEES